MNGAELLGSWAGCPLLDGLAPAGERRTSGDTRLTLATAALGGRRVLLAALDGHAAAAAVEAAVLAESLGMLAIVVASSPLQGAVRANAPRAVHALVGPAPAAALDAGLVAAGLLPVVVGDPGEGLPLLVSADDATALNLAALLLGYLPGPDGTTPVYPPLELPEVTALDPAVRRNAVAALHSLGDDVLRVLPGASDELVLALGRIAGRTVALVAPQPLAGAALGVDALARLAFLVRLAGRTGLPLIVLGSPQEVAGEPGIRALLLRELAAGVAALRRPVLLLPDGAPASSVLTLLATAPGAVRLDPAAGLRSAIVGWLG